MLSPQAAHTQKLIQWREECHYRRQEGEENKRKIEILSRKIQHELVRNYTKSELEELLEMVEQGVSWRLVHIRREIE